MEREVLAVIEAGAARRWLGVGMLAAVAGLLFYSAFSVPAEPVWQAALVALGAVVLWLAARLRQATALRIELTEDGLRDSGGTEIARLGDIAAIERGTFALKPSNGFLLRTRCAGGRAWQPGLWWRLGRRIGIGGVTPKAQAKYMADLIAARLAARDQASDHLI